MNKFLTKVAKIFLGLSMAAGVGVAVSAGRKDASQVNATTLSISANDFSGLSGSYTSASDVSVGSAGFKFSYTDLIKNSEKFQFKKSSGIIWNTALPSNSTIDTITLTDISGSGTLTVCKGNSAKPSTSVTGTNNVYTINDSYFAVKNASGNAAYCKITIDYTTSGGSSTYTVTYDGNGKTSGSVPTDVTAYSSGATVTVEGNTGLLAKTGYTFGGWNTQADGNGTNYTAGSGQFTITQNTTLYAKWNEQSSGGGGSGDSDTLTAYNTRTDGSYGSWSGVKVSTDAVYAGQSCGGASDPNKNIQLRSSNSNSGIVTTTSGGKIKSVDVAWTSSTTAGRTLNVYGKNTAYTQATDLYNNSNQGTLLGTIVKGTSTQLTISNDYEFVGVRSASGAMYLDSITFTWETGGGDDDDFGTLTSIEIDENRSDYYSVFEVDEEYTSEGIVLTATDDENNTKTVSSGYTTDYDGHTFVNGDVGDQVEVTITYEEGGESVTCSYYITVLPLPVYRKNTKDMSGWQSSGTVFSDQVLTSDSKAWRMSEGEYYSSGSKYIFGDYSNNNTDNTDKCLWENFSGKKYYSSIASAMDETTHTYGFALYTQNFSINKPFRIDFMWENSSNLGANAYVYVLASTNGGYSWSKLNSVNISSETVVSWSGQTLKTTDNVLFALGFASGTKSAQLINVSMDIYGDSISTTNVWAAREISSITGGNNVEAEQNVTLSAFVVTTNYETPANTSITWESSDPSVATVTSGGVVTGVSVGTCTITAKATDNKGASNSLSFSVTEKLKRLGTISLNTQNVTTSFVKNSAFSYSGLVVTANYANGFDSETVTPTNVSTPDMTTAGNNKTVTVTYTINGTSASATYTIDVTPIVSDTITISGTGIAFENNRYTITVGPNYMDQISVTKNGDESSISSSSSNESIYFEDGYLMVESTDNDSGTITFSVGNATAYLDVTVIADESLDYVTPVDGHISCVQHQTVEFEFSLVNASQGEWTEPSNSAYTIDGTGDETGYYGQITLNEVCTNLEAEFSVETSEDTLTISLYLTASADSITGISVKTNPSKTTYEVGETFSATGLVISASRTSGVSRDLASNEYNIKNAPTVLNERGTKTITVELVADTSKTTTFTITVNMPSGLKIVTKTSNNDGGFEGSLISSDSSLINGMKVVIGNGDENDVTLLGKYSSGNNIPEVTSGITFDDETYSFSNSDLIYTLETGSNGTWKLVDADGRYIYAAGGTGKNNHLKAVAPASVTNNTPVEWDITINNGLTTIVCADSSVARNTLMYNNGSSLYSCYASGQTAIHLYSVTELEPTYSYNSIDLSVTIYDFIRAVYNNSDYYTCNDSGIGSSLTNWNNAATDTTYAALTPTDKENLANAVVRSPDGTKESCQLVADFLSQYDYIVWKYGKSYDYLGRVDAGTATVRQSINLLSVMVGENTNTVAIIVVISMVSVTAIGGYFFLRKRREEN